NGKEIELPKTPVRSTNQNGICDVTRYEVTVDEPITSLYPSCDNKNMKIEIDLQNSSEAIVTGTFNGLKKTYTIKQK
ncbi:MAG: hypothetical protein IJ139_02610, partial [Bacteroidaceae bacterium]|nr:hypothetical protein [Bacteroidaceae bacterium]